MANDTPTKEWLIGMLAPGYELKQEFIAELPDIGTVETLEGALARWLSERRDPWSYKPSWRQAKALQERDEARKLAVHYHDWLYKELVSRNEQSSCKVLLKNETKYPWLKEETK